MAIVGILTFIVTIVLIVIFANMAANIKSIREIAQYFYQQDKKHEKEKTPTTKDNT